MYKIYIYIYIYIFIWTRDLIPAAALVTALYYLRTHWTRTSWFIKASTFVDFSSFISNYYNYSTLAVQFSLDHTRDVRCCQLSLDQCLCFYQHFRHLCCKMLAHFASISTWQSLQLLFHWHLSSLKARAYTLSCYFHFDLFVFLLLASPNMLSIYTELDFIALIGSLSGASKISSKSATPRIINNRQQQSSNGHECVQFQFLIGCCLKMILRMWTCIAQKTFTS